MGRLAVAVVAIVTSLLAAEAATRLLDGYKVFSIGLQRARDVQPSGMPDLRHLPIPLADGVDSAWYEELPSQAPRSGVERELPSRAAIHTDDPSWPFYWWNAAFISDQLCHHRDGAPGGLDDFYLFDPIDGQPFPRYRYLPHAAPAGWFTPNAFGWRGAEISVNRPRDTIRLAFVGSSTTVGSYSSRFSHPELIGHWLDRWVQSRHLPYRFEVINAARAGIEATSIEAIVRTEVLSVDPDAFIYYEGANNFAPSWTLSMPDGVPARPTATFRQRSATENYSAVAARVFDAILKSGHDGGEPPKPHFRFTWPAGVVEQNPDVTRPEMLPIAMDTVVKNLDAIRRSVSTTGAELAISSFVWLADDGMKLDLSRHLTLFRYLNETYWPLTYAHIHRMAAFENAVFHNYTRAYGLVYLPMAESYPHDPDLFADAIHLTERGLRLQAWMFLQQLVPIVKARIESHAWPKPPAPTAPAADWASQPPKLVTRASVLQSCSATVH